MDDFDVIPSCSFYGRRKCRLPPPPDISDDSDTSNNENIALKQLVAN